MTGIEALTAMSQRFHAELQRLRAIEKIISKDPDKVVELYPSLAPLLKSAA
jgi:hypothetical protein